MARKFCKVPQNTDIWRVEVILVEEGFPGCLRVQTLVERVLHCTSATTLQILPALVSRTMDKITTHGRFSLLTMALDKVDFPEPELPAMPTRDTSAHGGE